MEDALKKLIISAVLLLIPVVAFALNENCGERDESVHSSCKSVKYKELPADLKKFMTKLKCDVKTGSSYDEGNSIDLNADGKPEYAFCCNESGHGPCEMKIFGKTAGKWTVLLDSMPGYSDTTPCFGFVALKEKHAGYNDVCIDDGVKRVIFFKNGKYKDVGK
jgi:hypothetical protein